MLPAAQTLRRLLADPDRILRTPCCHDALSAKLIQQSGKFNAAFLSGFGVAATRALPDVGLVSFEDSMQQCRTILDAVTHRNELSNSPNGFPVIVDADTGYGNEVNVRRTVATLGRLGAAGMMLEDQENPKRCGHTKGKRVVPIELALARVRAACDMRRELGLDLVIIARTDARTEMGLDHALYRAAKFAELGADCTFVEAPVSVHELEQIGQSKDCGEFKMCNMLLHGKTPALPSAQLKQMGFSLAAYPFDLLVSSISAMTSAIDRLDREDRQYDTKEVDAMWDVVGFNKYYAMEQRYKS